MFKNVNLNVWSGFGSVIEFPQVLDVVSRVVARAFSIWSLGTPCVRTEDRRGLVTGASSLGQAAGSSRRI
jgi:hypothetical protein